MARRFTIKAEDPSIEELLLNAVKNKNFLATNDESAFFR